MDNSVKTNTENLRAKIACDLGIKPQALSNKLNKNWIEFWEKFFESLKKRKEFGAINIWTDFKARIEQVLFPSSLRFSLIEIVRIWQLIFVSEIQFPNCNRIDLLQNWREIVSLGNLRICELNKSIA